MGSRHEPTTHRKTLTALEALNEFGCLTDAQLAHVTGRKPTAIRKQLTAYATADKVQRIPRRKSGPGRPSAVSCLTDSVWVQSPTREHQLQLNDVRLAWSMSQPAGEGLQVRTWDTQSVMLPPPPVAGVDPSASGYVRPDAIALIEHKCTARPLVVFIELDRGTESMTRSSTRQSSWEAKAELYQQADQLVRWRDWALGQASLEKEAVCRLTVVTTTASRLASIDDALQQTTPAVGAWLTRFTDITSRGPWAKVWRRSGEKTVRGFIRAE